MYQQESSREKMYLATNQFHIREILITDERLSEFMHKIANITIAK
jgi:hypothetical protein